MRLFRAITPTVWLLSLVSLFTDLSSELLYPVMPVYLKSIGFSVFMIGLLEGIAEAVAGLSKGYFGRLSDLRGKRLPFVQAGYGLAAISKIMLALFNTTIPVFISRLADRTGKGLRTSARDAMLSSESPPGKKAEVFGFHRGLDTVGAALGPLAALIYLYYYPGEYRTIFVIAIVPAILGVVITFLIKENPLPVNAGNIKRTGFFSYLSYWKRATPTYKQTVSILLLFTLINSSDMFLLLFIKHKGFSDTTMIGIYIFYNLIYALVAMPVGKIADRIGIKKILIAGLFLFTSTYAGISVAETLWQVVLVFFLYALHAACIESNAKALITNTAEIHDTATALGFFNSFNSLGLLIASIWTGWLWMVAGPQFPMLISAVGAMVAGCMLLFLYRPGARNNL